MGILTRSAFGVGLAVVLFPALLALADDLPFRIAENPKTLPETALIETSQGDIEISFYREEAPITVQNFVYLAEKGFYNGVIFHRYMPNFVIQGGDPTGTGKGGPGYTLPPEHSTVQHEPGTVTMARLPDPVNPERRSSGSQFSICLTRARHLDGHYSAFGKVISGMDAVQKLRKGDKIIRILLPRGK